MYTAVSTSDVKCLSPERRPSVFSTRSCAACSKAISYYLMYINILDHSTNVISPSPFHITITQQWMRGLETHGGSAERIHAFG